MTCPDLAQLASAAELREDQYDSVLVAHLAQCPACTEQLARLTLAANSLRALRPIFTADPAVVAQVHQALNRQPPWWAQAPARVVLASAVIALVALVVVGRNDDSFVERGSPASALAQRVGVEIFTSSKVGEAVHALRANELLGANQRLSFVVRNRSKQPISLMIFALDAANTVHWFYPAYQDVNDDPRSVLVAAEPSEQAFPEAVAPVDPAPGELRIVSLFSNEPLNVSTIEASLRDHPEQSLTTLPSVISVTTLRVQQK